MKRARRVTLAAAALGAGVLAVLVAVNWNTVRDHVEAWHFQLTTETQTAIPWTGAPDVPGTIDASFLHGLLADSSGKPVIFDPGSCPVVARPVRQVTMEFVFLSFKQRCYHVLEQRFPRRAYVIIGEPDRLGGGGR